MTARRAFARRFWRGPSIRTRWTLTPDQANFLRALNRDGAIADLGDALQGNVSLQPGEYSLAGERRTSFRAADRGN